MRKFIFLLLAILICFVQASDSAPAPQPASGNPPPGPIPASFFGLHVINGNWPTVSFGVIRSSGVGWPTIETSKGQFNWSELDNQANRAQQHGKPLYYATDGVPGWTSNVTQDWSDFITALVTRYKGKIEVYEGWNEPDQDPQLPSMSTFVAMMKQMHDIVRQIDPSALIASPAVTGDPSWMDGYWAAGGVKDVDVVALHGYPSNIPSQPEIIGPEKADIMNSLMSKYGLTGKPLWDSEASWGDSTYGVTDLQQQAGFVARFFLLHWSNGFTRFYWYSWDDNGNGPGGVGWGTIFNPNTHQALPAATAFQQVYNWMVGATMNGPCTMASDSTWTCTLTRGNTQALAIWNSATTKSFTPPTQYTQYRDLAGNTVQVRGSLTIGYNPILLMTAALPAAPTNLRVITVK